MHGVLRLAVHAHLALPEAACEVLLTVTLFCTLWGKRDMHTGIQKHDTQVPRWHCHPDAS
jgi:hypothetical protein